jgi:hypothetical protein
VPGAQGGGDAARVWCRDLGLRSNKGALAVRIAELNANNGWVNKFINGATVKITDQSGSVTKSTLTSKQEFGSEDGWAIFEDIEPGSYGLLAYKNGFEGVWKKLNCNAPVGSFDNASLQNSNTENLKAAWNDSAIVQSGQITWCQDLGLRSETQAKGNIRLRIAEFQNNVYQGKFINDATVKLTDPSGNTIIDTKSSGKRPDGEDGWVEFNGVNAGTYGIMAYKSGFDGIWKKLSCDGPQGDFNNATINNLNTEGRIAAWNSVTVQNNQTVYCKDLGLQTSGTAALSAPQAGPGPSGDKKNEATPGAEIDTKQNESTAGGQQN